MGYQVSASKTDLLLHCRRPFHPDIDAPAVESTEPMRYGSCQHAMLEIALGGERVDFAGVCAKWGVVDVDAATRHHRITLAALETFMAKEGNPFGVAFKVSSVEVPLATQIISSTPRRPPSSRECDFNAETHTYDLRPGEISGTYDVLLYAPTWGFIVVDLKTGSYGDWTSPASLGQMRTLVMQSRYKHKSAGRASSPMRWAAAILHSEAGGVPVTYCEEVTLAETRIHLEVMKDAVSRIGDGTLCPGEWCFRCPAREGCPANDGALLARSGALVKMSTAELLREAVEPGALHMFLQQFETLAKRAREALKAEVRRGVVINRPDGKTLILRPQAGKETLSKAGIVRALGKEEGERVIEELRARGCLTTGEDTEVLVAVNDS